ncbi:MAG: glycosyltransferase family 2 protein [Clostridia bacterium]|nr:glycosyltransferase family 2 protein [Clostridia bacterium]
MISVIVPVYNVEAYLAQCLDSVLAQTYHDLEILLIDDGSTDRSGSICDAYQAKDERIRVFHTDNHGLSAARNVGLDHASGDYILLLDSDDWIDENTAQILLEYAARYEADVVSCAYYCEWKNRRDIKEKLDHPIILEGKQIMRAHIQEPYLGYVPWNKLYDKRLFSDIRYPAGRKHEDVIITHKLLESAERVVCIPEALFHYRKRANTISRVYSMDSMVAYWEAHDERYKALSKAYPEYQDALIEECFRAISRMCRWYASFSKTERARGEAVMQEMQSFAKQHERRILQGKHFSFMTKVSCICVKKRSRVLFTLLNLLVRVYMIGKNRKMYAF